jgi:hypothetical protein
MSRTYTIRLGRFPKGAKTMEKNKNQMMKLLGVGLSLSLLWGVSLSIAAPPIQTESKTMPGIQRSVTTPAVQPRSIHRATQQNVYQAKPNLVTPKFDKSQMLKPSTAGIPKATTNKPLILKQDMVKTPIKPGFEEKGIIIVGGKGKVNPADPVGRLGKINPGGAVGLNPQPLPPKDVSGIRKNLQESVGLNTQPPIILKRDMVKTPINPGEAVGLNPQQRLPKDLIGIRKNLEKDVGLNTQPLASKALIDAARQKQQADDGSVDYGGVNIQEQKEQIAAKAAADEAGKHPLYPPSDMMPPPPGPPQQQSGNNQPEPTLGDRIENAAWWCLLHPPCGAAAVFLPLVPKWGP